MGREYWLRKKDRLTTFGVGFYFFIVVGSGLYFKVLDPGSHQQNLSSFMIIAVSALLILIKWYFVAYEYRCLHCGHCQRITMIQDLFTPWWPLNKKLLRCPQCKRRSWMPESK